MELRIQAPDGKHHELLARIAPRVFAPAVAGAGRECLDEHPPGIGRCRCRATRRARGAPARRRQRRGSRGWLAAEVYGLKILATDRGLCRQHHALPGARSQALLSERRGTAPRCWSRWGTPTRPGALYRLLEPLAKHRLSLTRIESRPSRRRKWDYVFFMDLEGHAEDRHVAKALAALKLRASLFRILGSYPRAVQ